MTRARTKAVEMQVIRKVWDPEAFREYIPWNFLENWIRRERHVTPQPLWSSPAP